MNFADTHGHKIHTSLKNRLSALQSEAQEAQTPIGDYNLWAVPLADKTRAFRLEQVQIDAQAQVWLRGAGQDGALLTHYVEGAYQFEVRKASSSEDHCKVEFPSLV
ncbi:hypothetical protein [Cupriavidus sp. BIS7]|uniref:hypothetical protein n=1 Tax=Cupriavidus sp. BIS7 TaxID=1217718 RepID=UPI0003098339|nr:hypothetical protein [Cupriavidus sp. BIS7]